MSLQERAKQLAAEIKKQVMDEMRDKMKQRMKGACEQLVKEFRCTTLEALAAIDKASK